MFFWQRKTRAVCSKQGKLKMQLIPPLFMATAHLGFSLSPSTEYYFYVTYIWQISDHLSDCRYRPPLLWVSIFGPFQEATFSLKIAVSLPQVSESPTFLWHLLLASLQFFSSLNVTHRTIVAYLPDLLIVFQLQLI